VIPTRRIDYSEAIELSRSGWTQAKIATYFGVHQSSISRILSGGMCDTCNEPVNSRKRRDRRLCRACWLKEVRRP
jgi:predicted transcriptional regulator